jgi:hypothetical protein
MMKIGNQCLGNEINVVEYENGLVTYMVDVRKWTIW